MVEIKGGKFITLQFFDAMHSCFENIVLPSGMRFHDMTDCAFSLFFMNQADLRGLSIESSSFELCEFMDAYFYGANMTDCCLDQFSMESLRASKTKNYDGINYEVRASEEGDVLYVERHAFA